MTVTSDTAENLIVAHREIVHLAKWARQLQFDNVADHLEFVERILRAEIAPPDADSLPEKTRRRPKRARAIQPAAYGPRRLL